MCRLLPAIYKVTDAVKDRSLSSKIDKMDTLHPFVYMWLYVVKVHQNGSVINKAVSFPARSIPKVRKALPAWPSGNEGTKVLTSVLTGAEKGLQDILDCLCDGLKGFPMR